MAIGFPASYSTKIALLISREAAREVIIHTLQTLNWRLDVDGPYIFRGTVTISLASFGEFVTISLENAGFIEISSTCRSILPFSPIFDWGKNKRNVKRFIDEFELKAIRHNPSFPDEPVYFDADGKTPIQRVIVENVGLKTHE